MFNDIVIYLNSETLKFYYLTTNKEKKLDTIQFVDEWVQRDRYHNKKKRIDEDIMLTETYLLHNSEQVH